MIDNTCLTLSDMKETPPFTFRDYKDMSNQLRQFRNRTLPRLYQFDQHRAVHELTKDLEDAVYLLQSLFDEVVSGSGDTPTVDEPINIDVTRNLTRQDYIDLGREFKQMLNSETFWQLRRFGSYFPTIDGLATLFIDAFDRLRCKLDDLICTWTYGQDPRNLARHVFYGAMSLVPAETANDPDDFFAGLQPT